MFLFYYILINIVFLLIKILLFKIFIYSTFFMIFLIGFLLQMFSLS